MGVTKTTLQEGSGAQPTNGQTVTIEYTGWLKDESKPNKKGNKYVCPLDQLGQCVTNQAANKITRVKGSTLPSAVVTLLSRLALARLSRVCYVNVAIPYW